MTTTTPNANDVLMGGGGAPAAKFDEPGATWEGQIVAPPQSHQVRKYDPNNPGGGELATYPSGDPIMGVTVDIQTNVRDQTIQDDDGVRRIYLDGRYNKEAVRDAVRAAGAPGLEVGGHLKITFTHREDPMDKRSRKFWQVVYTPAGNAALMAGQPAAAPAQTAQPAVTPGGTTVPAQQPAPPAATATAPAQPAAGPTPVDTARQLIAAGGLTDEQIAQASGLAPAVVASLHNLPAPS